MSLRASVAALAPGLLLALALYAGEAAAQNVCRGGAHTGGGIIACIEGAGSSANILVNPGKLGIDHATANAAAIGGSHSGSGDVELRMTAGSVVTRGTAGHGLYARHAGATGGGGVVVRMSGGSVETRGANAYAIQGRRSSGTGNVRIDLTGGSLSRRTGGTGGVVLGAHGGTGNVTVTMTAGATLEATGAGVGGLIAAHSGTGDLTIGLTGGSVATTGLGIGATRSNAVTAGNVAVTVSHASSAVRTTGALGHGVSIVNIAGGATITMRDGLVETTGAGALGLHADSYSDTESSPGTTSIVLEGGTVRTRGGIHTFSNVNYYSHGIRAQSNYTRGDVSVRMTGGAVETAGAGAYGIFVVKGGLAGAGSIEMTGGAITTAGDGASGAYVVHSYGLTGASANTEGLSIDVAGAVSVEGLNTSVDGLITRGLLGVHRGWGSAAVRTRAAAEIAAPFAVGMEGRLTNDASAAGRIVVTHEGAVEARDVGVLAWAARSSGLTRGAGAQTADDAARTAPMIHVASSGDVTVGASVTDAFIRARIAGADEKLSTGEQAVLSEITAGDSTALTKALAALPASYDAAWKAEARNLLRKRAASSAAPTGDGPAAHRAAEEILGLSRAGIRASALSHTAIADRVRAGDALSTAERAALDAVLTEGPGSELETALSALTGAAYTTRWKHEVRQLAATYNAGDIRVDVTGGSITAEGNGVEALYAVPHDSNGAIAVTVAAGARVTGGANGVFVRGAGAEEGLRAQSVTVNGAVTGGTGAGVRMIDGGRLVVGKTGRVGATSGVGVLSDGAGDLHATVEGTVEGDVRIRGGGALKLEMREGGAVTGTVRDLVGPLTVAGSIGRVLYSSGGAVTVTGAGRLTGVDGVALRSESGDLSLTVADKGVVTGDVQARGGGRLTVDLQAGGTIAGTVHDPVGPLTVAGSIGRVLYSSGGAVTVTGAGRLTGVDGVALRSESGDLSLTVADKGVVTGDVQARGGGRLTVDLQAGGTIAGTVHDPVGPLTVAGSIGRLLYSSGGAVAVAGTGRLTGVDGVALRSESGDLSLTVADKGVVTGDVDARGDGDLTVAVSGTVDGDIFGRGAGKHTVTVARGGAVTGTVDLSASTVTTDGAVGRIRFERGGAAAVGSTGRISGVDGVAVDSRSGDLTVMVSGTVDGDVFGRGAGEHAVTVARGGAITGTVDLTGDGAVTVEGEAKRVRFERDGAVTVGPAGRIPGVDGVSVESRSGAPAVTIVASADESVSDAAKRVGGAIVAPGGEPSVMFHREGEAVSRTLGGLGTARSVPDGAYDVGLAPAAAGRFELARRLAPRTRVYEALPSLLLGMERPMSHAERASAARASNGAWTRVDALRGSWEAAESTNAGTAYDHRGFSFQTGLDAVLGEETQAGVSVHWRRATAEVSRNGGEVEARGAGVGLSATWSRGPFFVDGQAAATFYDADLKSTLRGRLKDGVAARGLSAVLEAGRAVPVADGATVTPRARVAWSSLSLSDFDDSVGARVSLDRGRSLTGRAGALAERVFGEGGRIFGSVDVEREFAAETRMSVAGTSLEATGEETRWLVGVGGEHGWEEGRFVLRGALGYAASGGDTRDYGGRVSLSMRF